MEAPDTYIHSQATTGSGEITMSMTCAIGRNRLTLMMPKTCGHGRNWACDLRALIAASDIVRNPDRRRALSASALIGANNMVDRIKRCNLGQIFAAWKHITDEEQNFQVLIDRESKRPRIAV